MSNRLTKGKARVGSLAVDTSGGVDFGTDGVVASRKIKALAFLGTATSEKTLSWNLPDNSIVHDVYVKITTASSAAGSMNVGLITTSSGDADGFIAALGTSSTGSFCPGPTYTAATSGDKITANNRGILLSAWTTNSTQDEYGHYAQFSYPTTGNKMLETGLSATLNSTSGTAGYIYIEYTEL